jgi:hypothetical protein
MIRRRQLALAGAGFLAAPVVLNREATAQGTRLRWAHVYEVNEP